MLKAELLNISHYFYDVLESGKFQNIFFFHTLSSNSLRILCPLTSNACISEGLAPYFHGAHSYFAFPTFFSSTILENEYAGPPAGLLTSSEGCWNLSP